MNKHEDPADSEPAMADSVIPLRPYFASHPEVQASIDGQVLLQAEYLLSRGACATKDALRRRMEYVSGEECPMRLIWESVQRLKDQGRWPEQGRRGVQ